MPGNLELFDGLFHDRLVLEDDKLFRVRSQVNRQAILAENARLRNEQQKRTDGMRWALSIPEDDYSELLRLRPELNSPSASVRDAAWRQFMLSPESMMYRVYEARRGRTV